MQTLLGLVAMAWSIRVSYCVVSTDMSVSESLPAIVQIDAGTQFHTKDRFAAKQAAEKLNHYAASNGKWTIGGLNKPDVFNLITHNGMA